jgi:hypothetical protein
MARNLGSNELEKFRLFAEFSQLDINRSSIRYRPPNEPDILCEVAGELVAFELRELIEEEFAARTFSAIELQELLYQDYEALPSPKKERINQVLGDAAIFIDFNTDVSINQRKRCLPVILEFLQSLNKKSFGDMTLPPPLSEEVKKIHIHRGGYSKPYLSINSAGFLDDPTTKSVADKFGKTYEKKHPVELLLYFYHQPDTNPQRWLPQIDAYVKSKIATSPFRRVWVVDIPNKIVRYIYPTR